jgi:hypothetical protein
MNQTSSTLNEVFSRPNARRRYEVWFIRMGLADGSGAWWFRYLLMNPGRGGCHGNPRGAPVQVWATYFPKGGRAQSFIESFRSENLALSARAEQPFGFAAGETGMDDNSCHGNLHVSGHDVDWNLRYTSKFRTVLSHKGWIGFSQTPHSDAIFEGEITFDGHTTRGTPLGYGVQGHNCGYRHRNFWTWTHIFFLRPGKSPSTLEALEYEMPFGLRFRKAVLWHDGVEYVFRKVQETRRDRTSLRWEFVCSTADSELSVSVDGGGAGVHTLPYLKTNCARTFEVTNNSFASARSVFRKANGAAETLETNGGAVLEMVG